MAIFRGVGGSGDSSDNSYLQEVTAQANTASASASAASASAVLAQASADSILTLTAATGDAGTDVSYNASTGVLTVPRGADGSDASVTAANVTGVLTGGTGISIASNGTITNDSPDQTVALTGTGATTITGTYPNFTINSTNTTYTVGDGGLTTNDFTDADHSKLDGIEASADVTDTANVTAAGALMDSEVTNLAQVKAFDSSDYATATQGTTADNALPKAGGQMTGNITFSGTQTVDGRDVSVDGAKLDTLERVYRRRFSKNAYSFSAVLHSLTTTYTAISDTIRGHITTGSENELDLQITASHYDINSANEFIFYVRAIAPYSGAEDTVNLGTVSDVSGTTTSIRTFAVSGDITKHLSPYCGMSTTSTGANAFSFNNNHSWYYDSVSNKTIMTAYNYQSNLPSDGDTLYVHPFDWESTGTQLTGDLYPAEAYNANGTVNIRRDYKFYLGYFKNRPVLDVYAKESSSAENIVITSVGGVLTQYQD